MATPPATTDPAHPAADKAVVLLSGGLDSYTTAAIAQSQGFICYALTVAYGQRHHQEIACAKKIAHSLHLPEHKIIDIDLAAIGGSALLGTDTPVPKTNTGIAPLIDQIEDTLHNEIHTCPPDALALTSRQRQSLTAAAESLRQANVLLADRPTDNLELVALELRDALDHLGAISGQLTPDDLLDRIFSRFCVGK